MKWLFNRFTYPLVIVAVVVSIIFQGFWLTQLYNAQEYSVRQELEKITGETANMSAYLSEVTGHEGSKNFREFFLSKEWLQFKQAYNNIRFKNVGSRYGVDTKGDSTFVYINLRLSNVETSHPKGGGKIVHLDQPLQKLRSADSIDLNKMDSLMKKSLLQIGPHFTYYYAINNFDNGKLVSGPQSDKIKKAAFRSQQYNYNLKLLNTYQLIVPSLSRLVVYRMRYYLASSLLLITLTVAVFYFILRLLHDQKLYHEARVAFTGNMTHELKTPVATISLALDSIAANESSGKFSPTTNEYLEISRGEISRLNLMIDKVINLDRIDQGFVKLRHELFDVQQGLNQVISSMKIQLEKAAATMEWMPSDTPLFVYGDPVHLTNVFFNLIENSIKYGGNGVKITVNSFLDRNNVIVRLEDNGPGIATEYQHHVFERYFRVPQGGEKHDIKGSGLGLNYVANIIDRHKGTITLQSHQEKGCIFAINLQAAL